MLCSACLSLLGCPVCFALYAGTPLAEPESPPARTGYTHSMIAPPTFASHQERRARIGDVDFWWPYLSEILARHGLADARHEPVAGHNATYPTFLYGDVVVKLFGNTPWWREGHAAERGAQRLIATDPEIAAPRLLSEGRVCDDPDASWPYLITTRISGVPLWRAELSPEQERAVAAQVGRQLRRVHALAPSGVASDADWPALDVTAAARRSSLPPHLVVQVDAYLTRLEPFDRVFVHGDLVANHAYVEDGRLVGIIDWGDATVADRHYEVIQVYRDLFHCDKELLQVFLDAADWPVDDDFPYRAMSLALIRQAVGLTQHHGIDVFMPVAERFPLQDIGTLDELATELFGF